MERIPRPQHILIPSDEVSAPEGTGVKSLTYPNLKNHIDALQFKARQVKPNTFLYILAHDQSVPSDPVLFDLVVLIQSEEQIQNLLQLFRQPHPPRKPQLLLPH